MQKKNRKGFTLIELLAVIVILAIIALIAVPVIMNVITKARVSAFEDSAYGIVKAGEMYYTNKLLDAEGMTEDQEFTVVNDVFQNTENSAETLEISGSLPSSGKVTVTSEGKVALVISNGEYCIQKSTSESKVEAVKQANCTDYKRTANPIFTTSDANATIPTCIKDNTECSVGTAVAVKVNDSETKDFYVIKDESNKLTLIMNQNIGTSAWITKDDYLKAGGTEVEWGTSGNTNKGPITALNYLEKETSSWTNIPATTYQVVDEYNSYSPITRTSRARMLDTYHGGRWDFLCDTREFWASYAFDESHGFKHYCQENSNDGGVTIYYFLTDSWSYVNQGSGIRPVITISKSVL